MKGYNIKKIEKLTESEAIALAQDTTIVKGYSIYFIDFGGYFGFSALVFANGHHIHHCNDYALHHSGKTEEELKKYYVESLSEKLFTKDELQTVASYDDYTAKDYYIRNYHSMRENYISIWFVGTDEERAKRQQEIQKMYYSDIAFAYYNSKNFVNELADLMQTLDTAKKRAENNFDYIKAAFLKEMYNHEYGINWQADYDTISAFANVSSVKDYENINELFEVAGFDDLKKSAYMAARKEYFKNANY